MQRRQFLKTGSIILATLPLLKLKPLQSNAVNEVVKFSIGNWSCTLFRDNLFTYQAKDFFINAGETELQQQLDRYAVAQGNIPSPFIALLLQQGDKKILIDTGVGFSEKPVDVRGKSMVFKGRLLQLLQQENIAKESITDVIITHFHPDHIGGIFSGEKLNFPHARFHMHETEWDYWHSSKSDHQPDQFKYFVEKNITGLQQHDLRLVRGESSDILPGISAILAEGHTPGQLALNIHSNKEKLLYISDAILHPIHIERTDWQTNYDLDHEKARQSRIKLLQTAYENNMLVNAFHFDFPGLGRVQKANSGWKWEYEKMRLAGAS